jgi:hypothetical protein
MKTIIITRRMDTFEKRLADLTKDFTTFKKEIDSDKTSVTKEVSPKEKKEK